MKKNLFIMVSLLAVTLCVGCGSKKEEAQDVSGQEKEAVESVQEDTAAEEESQDADLTSFANSIAQGFTDATGFDAQGDFSEADGIVITIEQEGVGDWLDHAWDEMKDAINESYEESEATINHAGAEGTSLTYKVVDENNTAYYIFKDGSEVSE